jgi:hypothetical protein
VGATKGNAKFNLQLGNGANNVTFEAGSVVTGSATVQMGTGNDTFTFAGTVGTKSNGGRLTVNMGTGDDSVTFAATAQLFAEGKIYLGTGDDTFTLENRSKKLAARVVGGGFDTFQGNPKQLTTKPVGFSTFI